MPATRNILTSLIQFLSNSQAPETDIPESRRQNIANWLSGVAPLSYHTDNAETILQSGAHAGCYLEGYEDYGLLIRRVGEVSHSSCLVLVGKTQSGITGRKSTNSSLITTTGGLKSEEGQKSFTWGLMEQSPKRALVERYCGNALAWR